MRKESAEKDRRGKIFTHPQMAGQKTGGLKSPPGGVYFRVGSSSVGLGMGCSLWAAMAWISSTVRPSPK